MVESTAKNGVSFNSRGKIKGESRKVMFVNWFRGYIDSFNRKEIIMKKRFLGALLIGLLFMIGGCASNAKKPEKYDYLMEWEFGVSDGKPSILEVSELIEKDMKTFGYNVTGLPYGDAEATEKYLEDCIYGEWYKDGKNTSIEINETYYDDIEYGVYYAVRSVMNDNAYVKIFDLANEENVFYMVRTSILGPVSRRHLCYCLYVFDGKGNHYASYKDVSQVDYEILRKLDK